jgi:peroxiredoxin
MKKIVFLLPVLLLLVACSTKDQFKIQGKIDNAEGKVLYFEKLGIEESFPIDSVKLGKDGRFAFKGDRLMEPTFFMLKLSDKDFITLLADSIETIEVEGDGTNLAQTYRPQNSIGSAYIQVLNKKITTLQSIVDERLEAYAKADAEKQQQIIEELNEAFKGHKDFVGQFVMDNPRSFASYYALFLRLNDGSLVMNVMDKKDQVYFSTVATSLNLLYPESERVKHLYNHVLQVKAQQRKDQYQKLLLDQADERGFPDIEEKDVNGEMVKLSSLEGKVIILSFWASWNEASRKANKQLKNVYDKYHGRGLEIYQVSLDRSKVLWENAIEKDELPWINVSDLRYTESLAARLYNVQQLPANFIINRKGEIVGKDLFGQRLNEKMEELF